MGLSKEHRGLIRISFLQLPSSMYVPSVLVFTIYLLGKQEARKKNYGILQYNCYSLFFIN